MRTVSDFIDEISKARLRPEPGYGGTVMPAAEIFSRIELPEEARAYQSALELLLQSDDPEMRAFAVDLCLGFFVFSDAICRPDFSRKLNIGR